MKLFKTIAAALFLSAVVTVGIFCGTSDSPRLVIFIVVDQMRADTFDRFEDIFQGGMKFLVQEGVYFSEARHVHAFATTGPGHFVLASGRYPGPAGILEA